MKLKQQMIPESPLLMLGAVAPHMEACGIDGRRLLHLAAVIEHLPPWPPGPATELRGVDEGTACTHFTLRVRLRRGQAGQYGFGLRRDASPDSPHALTGKGLITGAWAGGLAAVACNDRVDQIRQVLTAAPLFDEKEVSYIGKASTTRHVTQALYGYADSYLEKTITPRHVAQALYAYIENLDPFEAWLDAMRPHPLAGRLQRAVTEG